MEVTGFLESSHCTTLFHGGTIWCSDVRVFLVAELIVGSSMISFLYLRYVIEYFLLFCSVDYSLIDMLIFKWDHQKYMAV